MVSPRVAAQLKESSLVESRLKRKGEGTGDEEKEGYSSAMISAIIHASCIQTDYPYRFVEVREARDRFIRVH